MFHFLNVFSFLIKLKVCRRIRTFLTEQLKFQTPDAVSVMFKLHQVSIYALLQYCNINEAKTGTRRATLQSKKHLFNG